MRKGEKGVQTAVEKDEGRAFKSCVYVRDRERHLLVHLLPLFEQPLPIINITLFLFSADSEEHN